jgi:hypothetical protein
MAATVEAILGAVHCDGGDQALGQVMETLGLTHDLLESGNVLSLPMLLIMTLLEVVMLRTSPYPPLGPLVRLDSSSLRGS